MSSDCSVAANPLAQLNKHTQVNNFQNGSSLGFSNGNAPTQFKSQINQVSDVNKFQMNQFMDKSGGNIGGTLGMAPINQPYMQQSSNGNWSQQFSSSSDSLRGSMKAGSPVNSWVSEFRPGNVAQSSRSPLSAHTQPAMSGLGSYGKTGMTHHMMRPMMHSGMARMGSHIPMQHQSHLQSSSQMTESAWEEQFKDLEKEVSEHLSLNETKEKQEISQAEKAEIVVNDDYQAEFQEVWNKLQSQTDYGMDTSDSKWEEDYSKYMSGKSMKSVPYSFDSDNQFLHNPNAYEIGCLLMENGAKLSEAALAFEAAVQEDPGHVDAWLKLGLVQTQNEKEVNGISALEQCLKLDPNNLDALMTISISYINEGYDFSAFSMLNRWLEAKYGSLVTTPNIDEANIDRFNLNKQVIARFLQVANSLPQVDPEVQLGLGTLFYANEDFSKTIDCFRAALDVHPNDELMWNRLGASLANSNRSEEAIQAYHKALNLKPSFVRARYNLAISSMNIGCYKEAAESLLTALSMHEVEGVPMTGSVVQSNNILETLKRAFIAMERRDLLEKVMPGMDLQQFRNEFKF